jgi:lactate dehydrogenase-like 2-hydroxyacid dehydrogenase
VDGELGGYGADVIGNDASWGRSVRPNEITPLIDQGYNVVVTPHIGGFTREAIAETRSIIVDLLFKEYPSLKTTR